MEKRRVYIDLQFCERFQFSPELKYVVEDQFQAGDGWVYLVKNNEGEVIAIQEESCKFDEN